MILVILIARSFTDFNRKCIVKTCDLFQTQMYYAGGLNVFKID